MSHTAFTVVRKLTISMSTPIDKVNNSLLLLESLLGVKDIHYIGRKNQLTVRYDASTLNISRVLELLDVEGVSIVTSRWQTYRIAYYSFVDKNVFNNARYKPVCCNKPPVRKRY